MLAYRPSGREPRLYAGPGAGFRTTRAGTTRRARTRVTSRCC
ncbi:hypothetical protein NKH77_16105 [Streptomyces sp. M19]